MSKVKQHVVAIIPARGGSKGIPGKNIRLLAGKPLIAHAIEAAKKSKLLNRIIVSTDDKKIAEVAKEYGAEVPFMRPKELATNDATAESVLKHAVEWLEKNENYKIDIVVYLQPTDVFRKSEWIDECIKRLLENENLESAFVAYRNHKNYWRKVGDKFVRLTPERGYTEEGGYLPRQKKESVFREDTGLACATRAYLVKQGKRLGDAVAIIENEDRASFIDIHDEFDLWLAEKVLTEWRRGKKHGES